MAPSGHPHTLVLGGIRSGKSEYAEGLAASAPRVRYLATARDDGSDPAWSARIAAHRDRRPADWASAEVGSAPGDLIDAFAGAVAGETLIVDDLGTWLAGAQELCDGDGAALRLLVDRLADAVAACPATVVLVSPEVGLSLVPATPLGAAFADALGALNRAVAAVCERVVLVVAGQPVDIKPPATGGVAIPRSTEGLADPPARGTVSAVHQTTVPPVPVPGDATDSGAPEEIVPGLTLPRPDDAAAQAVLDRLTSLDLGVGTPANPGLGALADAVAFAAGTRGSPYPRPFLASRVVLVAGGHEGGVAAGYAAEAGRRPAPLTYLAGAAGASLVTLEWENAAAPIETSDAIGPAQLQAALRAGWAEAERAADEGIELLVLAATGAGAATAATAAIAAVTGAEVQPLLARVVTADGYDDESWMRRSAAVRDALHRVRRRDGDPRTVLMALGGSDLAAATGLLLGAASRRTPVMIDGPVGAAAALLARDFSFLSRMWHLLPDHGRHPATKLAADVLGLETFLDLRLDLGEGATALAALPLWQAALTIAGGGAGRTGEAGETDAGDEADDGADAT
ncbi:bifunctional adenosylcobinamide kinase/adenosylcobinamide-phosphate guanylyltransferase [Luedemannella helvata]|uniref:Adenosylcobinamide kinase n=1 Tax=Luedemannella helvata TaxID=349315 RepID=A0ABN2JZI2_9ACTN